MNQMTAVEKIMLLTSTITGYPLATEAAKGADAGTRRPVDQALRVLAHDSRFLGDGVDIRLRSVDIVLVVLDDLGGDVMVSVEVVLRASLRGRGRASERHASAAAVGNEIRCGWDAREPPAVRSEEGMVITDIGRCRRAAIVVGPGDGDITPSATFRQPRRTGGRRIRPPVLRVMCKLEAFNSGLTLFRNVPDDMGDGIGLVLEVPIRHVDECLRRDSSTSSIQVLEEPLVIARLASSLGYTFVSLKDSLQRGINNMPSTASTASCAAKPASISAASSSGDVRVLTRCSMW